MAAVTKTSAYQARPADKEGWVNYTAIEDDTWARLYARQQKIIQGRACDEYLEGLEILQLSSDRVAQIPEVNRRLEAASGWRLQPVAAVIPFGEFFELLSQRKFPAATFIRRPEDFDYLQEPDIFHEIYGHCPMLTQPVFADFVQEYGKLGVAASHKQRVFLARLFWFSVEFGLINTPAGLRSYGGGILSSIAETVYALEDDRPRRLPWEPLTVLRTPYRIDIMQPIYFVIDSYQQLYQSMAEPVMEKVQEAMTRGLLPPAFPPKEKTTTAVDRHDC